MTQRRKEGKSLTNIECCCAHCFQSIFSVFGMKKVGVAKERGCASDNMLVCIQLNIYLTIRKVKLNARNLFHLSWALHYNSIPAIHLPLYSHFIDCVFSAFQMSLCQLTKVCYVAQSLWRNSICRSAERNCQQTDWGVKIQLFCWLPKIKLFGWHNIETMCHWNSMRPPYYTDLIPYFFLLSHINLNI